MSLANKSPCIIVINIPRPKQFKRNMIVFLSQLLLECLTLFLFGSDEFIDRGGTGQSVGVLSSKTTDSHKNTSAEMATSDRISVLRINL